MVEIKPNQKSKVGELEVTCYGEGLIMVDHHLLSAPLPVGPSDKFWEEYDDEERARDIIDFFDRKINWEEIDTDLFIEFHGIVKDAREAV